MRICIYVICHKNYYIPPFKFSKGLQVGKFFYENTFPNMLNDYYNDNISHLNKSYCELTGQYWAWKNRPSDIIGFFHYRRYFNLKKQHFVSPYIIKKLPSIVQLENIGDDEKNINSIFLKTMLLYLYQKKYI